ncbi:unnamed protein product, partial [marine sediment metagenome]
ATLATSGETKLPRQQVAGLNGVAHWTCELSDIDKSLNIKEFNFDLAGWPIRAELRSPVSGASPNY